MARLRHRAALAASSAPRRSFPPRRRSRRTPPPPADPRSTPASASLPRSRSSARVRWRRPLPAWWRRRHLVSIRISRVRREQLPSTSAARVLRSCEAPNGCAPSYAPASSSSQSDTASISDGDNVKTRAMRCASKAPRASRRRVFVVPSPSSTSGRARRTSRAPPPRRRRRRPIDVSARRSTLRT